MHSVPQIDASDRSEARELSAAFVEAVRAACAEWGCFALVGHGIPAALELRFADQGRWTLIEAEPGSWVVNLGDMFQVWSNDRFSSPLHRVIASSQRERYSAPFFFNPSADSLCRPLSTPARYRPIRWAEFRSLRFAGDYADLGEEVQIAHYRTQDP